MSGVIPLVPIPADQWESNVVERISAIGYTKQSCTDHNTRSTGYIYRARKRKRNRVVEANKHSWMDARMASTVKVKWGKNKIAISIGYYLGNWRRSKYYMVLSDSETYYDCFVHTLTSHFQWIFEKPKSAQKFKSFENPAFFSPFQSTGHDDVHHDSWLCVPQQSDNIVICWAFNVHN
jgi:hypothetical protein